ncbi:hypothetical protein EKE94_06970 [Mesobaculum littorinae]|uniref:Uncharacterized protein n=1 Tax=Mesobaculum littorinae TaxID=2486419 RepID=A0A438AIZ1_9RHOB|nr:Tad domain-containing protein [Mesobaculum littorinae]RVV98648.1 hypothetical protein EKE94_06970 [Mesobaculum littorinae]
MDLHRTLRRFARDEGGALTILGLYLFAGMAVLGGLALDMTRLMVARTELQVAADSTAHAALYLRDGMEPDAARAGALDIGLANMPRDRFGEILRAEDIHFGSFDVETQSFVIDARGRDAVLVTTTRLRERANAVTTYLLQLVGAGSFDIRTEAVYETYVPRCLREGLFADDVIDVQSNNFYSSGFCMHSNAHVALNNNNTFEQGSVVSMPEIDDLDLPKSGFEKNDGLEEALFETTYQPKLTDRVDEILEGLAQVGSPYRPSYLGATTEIELKGKTIAQDDLVKGRLHRMTCGGGGGHVTIDAGVQLNQMVILTDCKVKFGADVLIEDAIVATTNTDARSLSGAADFAVGRDDGCAAGGGGKLVTAGGMDFAAKLALYGAQLVARGDIRFAAQAEGVEGVSIVAGGRIDGSSNMSISYCDGMGMEDIYQARYFRLAA